MPAYQGPLGWLPVPCATAREECYAGLMKRGHRKAIRAYSSDPTRCTTASAMTQQGTSTESSEIRKTVTILFTDVSGFTELGERLDPESLRQVMSRYFGAMRSALERHGGTVEKFIGDAVMAVFGIPMVHEDDALRAIKAAQDMRSELVSLNQELERAWGASIDIRTGVNTGEIVAGDPLTRLFARDR
jgi:class 3 adenylate cyclase